MENRFLDLCREAVNRIEAEHYPEGFGWIGFTQERNPVLWEEIKEAEGRLSEPEKENVNIEQFRLRLASYKSLIRLAVGRYVKVATKMATLSKTPNREES